MPEGVEVRVVEETAETIYLVLPGASPVGEAGELSDEELQSAAGGRGTEFPVTFNPYVPDVPC